MRSNIELWRLAPSNTLMDSTEEEIRDMEHIIDTLLLLANPAKLQNTENSDIVQISQKIVDLYPDADIHLTSSESSLQKKCYPELYKRILVNLIENAIKYKSSGTIVIEIGKTRITVKNPIKEDIDKDTLGHVTDAFYQLDTSRNTK
jgi:signal transduction histidine kinase